MNEEAELLDVFYACPICGRPEIGERVQEQIDMIGGEPDFENAIFVTYWECRKCHHSFEEPSRNEIWG